MHMHMHPTLLYVPHRTRQREERILQGPPSDYTVFEVFPGCFTVRDALGKCIYFGEGPVEVRRSPAPF